MTTAIYPVAVANLLEKISSICEAEKWNGVGHHPDVASAAVKVGLTPFSVFVGNCEDLVVEALCVGRLVRRVRMICCRMSKVESLLGKWWIALNCFFFRGTLFIIKQRIISNHFFFKSWIAFKSRRLMLETRVIFKLLNFYDRKNSTTYSQK